MAPSDGSRQWPVRGDQWSQTYYLLRDGKLFLAEDDNKEQTHSEWELDVEKFLRDHGADDEAPYPEIVAALRSARAAVTGRSR